MIFRQWLIEIAKYRPSSILAEYVFGWIIAAVGSSVVYIKVSPIWLSVTIPVGIFMAIHGHWREFVRGK